MEFQKLENCAQDARDRIEELRVSLNQSEEDFDTAIDKLGQIIRLAEAASEKVGDLSIDLTNLNRQS